MKLNKACRNIGYGIASQKVALANRGIITDRTKERIFIWIEIDKMNLKDCYIEEDLFPKIFAKFEERDYGILFYNTENKDSFDSNHAVIYRERIQNLQAVLSDIAGFYKARGSRPIIYQSMLDDNWFDEIKDELTAGVRFFAGMWNGAKRWE